MNTQKIELAAMNCHHRFFELEDFFASAKKNGYKYVEIWTGPQHFFMDHNGYESVKKLKDLEEKYGIKVIGICPEQTNPKPNNMAAKDLNMQERVLNYFKNAIDVACEIKAKQVVVTSGWGFLSESVEKAYKRSAIMLRKVADYAEDKNMNLAIEALQPEESLIANTALELKKLIDEVGKYIDKYYEPVKDDIKMDKEMKSIFDKITKFRKKRAEEKAFQEEPVKESSLSEDILPEEFDVSTMQKTKIQKGMSSTMSVNRNIDNLMNQLEETFSQRLLRMIDERGMTDSEAYTKAYVDRRHFSKIRKDVNYVPNKKTVLAFTIALELSLDEAKDLLASAGFALSRSSKTDIIVAYFLQNKIYDMFEINDVLDAYGQPVF